MPSSFATDLRQLRRRLSLSGRAFAQRFGLGADAVKAQEMGRYQPSAAMRVLVAAIDLDPDLIERAAAMVSGSPKCAIAIQPPTGSAMISKTDGDEHGRHQAAD